jgi:hypothetical protein
MANAGDDVIPDASDEKRCFDGLRNFQHRHVAFYQSLKGEFWLFVKFIKIWNARHQKSDLRV